MSGNDPATKPLPPAPAKAKKARTRRWRSPDEPCLNCGDPTRGRYCPSCGQRKVEVQVSVRTMLADVLEDQLALSGALPRTLGALLFRPGHLTNEYIRGRIVSYIAPFRLYLVASVVFFLLFSFLGLAALEEAEIGIRTDAASLESARDALAGFEEELAGVDTSALAPAARTALRATRARMEAAVATALADSALRAGARPGTVLPGAQDSAAAPRAPAAPAAPGGTMPDSATRDAGDALPETLAPDTEDRGRMQPWARELTIESPFPWLNEAVERKLAQVGHLPPREALDQVLQDYVEFAPHLVFVLLPVFAFLLKLLYLRRDRYYAEHFVFALHTHAFTFVAFTLMLLIPWDVIDRILLLWMVLYVWIAMRTVYRQGIVRTTLKWWVLGWTYMWVFVAGMVGLAIVTLVVT